MSMCCDNVTLSLGVKALLEIIHWQQHHLAAMQQVKWFQEARSFWVRIRVRVTKWDSANLDLFLPFCNCRNEKFLLFYCWMWKTIVFSLSVRDSALGLPSHAYVTLFRYLFFIFSRCLVFPFQKIFAWNNVVNLEEKGVGLIARFRGKTCG